MLCPRYDVNGDGVISFQEMKALVLCDFPRNLWSWDTWRCGVRLFSKESYCLEGIMPYWMAVIGFQTILWVKKYMMLHEKKKPLTTSEGSTKIEALKPVGFFHCDTRHQSLGNLYISPKAYRIAVLQLCMLCGSPWWTYPFKTWGFPQRKHPKSIFSTLCQAVLKQSTVGLTERDLRTVLKQAFL